MWLRNQVSDNAKISMLCVWSSWATSWTFCLRLHTFKCATLRYGVLEWLEEDCAAGLLTAWGGTCGEGDVGEDGSEVECDVGVALADSYVESIAAMAASLSSLPSKIILSLGRWHRWPFCRSSLKSGKTLRWFSCCCLVRSWFMKTGFPL